MSGEGCIGQLAQQLGCVRTNHVDCCVPRYYVSDLDRAVTRQVLLDPRAALRLLCGWTNHEEPSSKMNGWTELNIVIKLN